MAMMAMMSVVSVVSDAVRAGAHACRFAIALIIIAAAAIVVAMLVRGLGEGRHGAGRH
jgi:hypothetical protein